MPTEFLDTCLEVLLHEVGTLVLVIVQHHTLQDSLWELQFAHLLLHVLADIEQELIVAVCLELLTDLVCDLLAELLLILHSALAEGLVEQRLIHLCLHEAADLCDLIGEVALVVLHVLFLDLQQGRHLHVALRICLAGIPGDDVAQLSAIEEFLLVVHLHILGHQHCVGNGDATLFHITLLVQLTQVALQHVTLLWVKLLSLLVLSCTLLVHLHLLVDEFIVNSDVIVVDLILTTQRSLELRSHSDVELESQRIVALEVQCLLLVTWQGLTQHLDVVLTNILIEFLTQHLVHHVHLHGCPILALDQTHWRHAGAEARNVSTLTIVFQGLLDLSLIVVFLQSNGHQTINLVRSLK